jgi:hypothetical protein
MEENENLEKSSFNDMLRKNAYKNVKLTRN